MPDRRTSPPTLPFEPCRLPVVEPARLSNGTTLHRYSGGSEAVTLLTLVFGGGTAESSVAMRELYPTMLAEGAQGLSGTEIADRMDFYGARPAFRMTDHYTVLQMWMLNRNAREITRLLSRILGAPTFPSDRLERTKVVAKGRLAIEQDKVSVRASDAATAMIAGREHPATHVLTAEEIDAGDNAALADFHRVICGAENCHAFVGGLLDAEVDAAVNNMLLSLPRNTGSMPLDIRPFSPEEPQRRHIAMPGSVQTGLCITLPAIPRAHADYLPLRLAVMALGGYFGSRLMTNLREDKGITYGINSFLSGSLDGSAVIIAAQCASERTDLAIEEIGAEMTRLADSPPAGDELERLRLNASTTAISAIDTPAGIISQYITELTVGLPKGYFDCQQELVATLSPEIIADAARRYLRPELMRVAVCN